MPRSLFTRAVGVVAVVASVATFAIVTTSAASAVSSTAPPARAKVAPASVGFEPVGYQSPAPNSSLDITFHGGNIMKSPVVYNIYWLPSGHYESPGSAATDTRYENLLDRFFGDVGGSDFYRMLQQYPGLNGTPDNAVTFGGSYVDTTAYPSGEDGTTAHPLQDADIQAAATRGATHFSSPLDLNHIYMVYTALGVKECFGAGSCNFGSGAFCAYHDHFGMSSLYAFMGADGNGIGCDNNQAPNGDVYADAEISSASHEFIESATDPGLDAWYNVNLSGEISDLCNRVDGPHNLLAPGADVYLNGHPYDIQEQWSNAVHNCAMDLNVAGNGVVPPTLLINKTGPSTAVTGQQFTYTVTVNNPSDTDASTLTTVTDALPAGVTYVAGSASPTPTSTSPLTWNLSTLAVHDTDTITFKVSSGPQSVHNCAVVNYDDMLQIAAQPSQQSCSDTIVNQASTSTSVISSVNPSVFAQSVTFTATVTATPPGAGTPTGTVTFIDNGTPIGTGTLAGGQATFTTSTLAVGSHPITASYGGDSNFMSSTSPTLTQVVNRQPTTTTLAFTPPNPHINQAVTFTATVSPTIANPTPVTGTVSFYIDGSLTPAATVPLTGNTATFITTFGGGSHTVVAMYNGDANYAPSTSNTSTPTVACNQTITGTHSSLVVTSGVVCILNAHITGGISVAAGATLDLENSVVSGSISSNKSATFRMCGSHTGSVTVAKSAGFVLIGDPMNNCAANTVAGSILASNNTHGLVIVGNTVSATVTATGNSGAGPLPGETAPIVSGNHH